MLFNNLLTERRSSLIVKNSKFYIEIAKFVQAYVTIIKNPNEFLTEIGEPQIDKKKQHLNWGQLVKIMQTCDFGFENPPSRMDIAVYYNYALEMGTVDPLEKKIASVNEVAEAQKHYYNFVDEEKANAEIVYQRHKKILDAREREISYVNGKISVYKAKNWFAGIMLFVSVIIGMIGMVGFFVENAFVNAIGKIIPIWEPKYIGGIILIVVMFLLFWYFNSLFTETRRDLVKLQQASVTIFAREDELLAQDEILKRKLDEVSKDYETIQNEIHDPEKTFDVKHNIDVLKTNNKYYQKLCSSEELAEVSESLKNETLNTTENPAPVKLSKEQSENVRSVQKEAIDLVGTIDTEAYNKKFERSRHEKEEQEPETKEEQAEVEEKENDSKQKDLETQKKLKEQQEMLDKQKREADAENIQDSVKYVKDLLGMSNNESVHEK